MISFEEYVVRGFSLNTLTKTNKSQIWLHYYVHLLVAIILLCRFQRHIALTVLQHDLRLLVQLAVGRIISEWHKPSTTRWQFAYTCTIDNCMLFDGEMSGHLRGWNKIDGISHSPI